MRTPAEKEKSGYRNIWVIAEYLDGGVTEGTFELLGAGRRLADARRAELWCVLLGHGLAGCPRGIIARGADAVIVVDDPVLARFVDQVESAVLVRLLKRYKPEVLLCGATTRGRALMPRIAVQIDAGLTADCTDLEIDSGSGDLIQIRPAFGGGVLARIRSAGHRPQMATVRSRVMSPLDAEDSRTGRIITDRVREDEKRPGMTVRESIRDAERTVKLADAEFIVSGGRGVRGPEGFHLIRSLAKALGGAVGASRAAVDAGWVPYSFQVGQTGQTVQPRVYIACGVSGQIQHLVGMRSSDTIIAINRDPESPIMKLADIAVVGDLFEVVPALIEEIGRK